MNPIKLKITTKTQQYPIIIGSNFESSVAKIIKDKYKNSKIFNYYWFKFRG